MPYTGIGPCQQLLQLGTVCPPPPVNMPACAHVHAQVMRVRAPWVTSALFSPTNYIIPNPITGTVVLGGTTQVRHACMHASTRLQAPRSDQHACVHHVHATSAWASAGVAQA